MILNPIIANLHNVKTDRFHPIVFREAPLPGLPGDDVPIRHKSQGHHTRGFDTRNEAIAECEKILEQLKPDSIGDPKLSIERNLLWDGGDIPAMVVFFGEQYGKTVALIM